MTIPAEFEDIRPYIPEELPNVFDELEQDAQFRNIVAQVIRSEEHTSELQSLY